MTPTIGENALYIEVMMSVTFYFSLLTKTKKQQRMEKFTINENPEKVFGACKNINNFLTKEEKEKITVSKDGKSAKMNVPMIGNVNMILTSSDDDKIIRISCPEIGTVLAGKVSETVQNGQRMSEIKLVIEKCRPNISWAMGGSITENIIKSEAPKMLKKFSEELNKRLQEMK